MKTRAAPQYLRRGESNAVPVGHRHQLAGGGDHIGKKPHPLLTVVNGIAAKRNVCILRGGDDAFQYPHLLPGKALKGIDRYGFPLKIRDFQQCFVQSVELAGRVDIAFRHQRGVSAV